MMKAQPPNQPMAHRRGWPLAAMLAAAVLAVSGLSATGAAGADGSPASDQDIVVPTELCRGFWFIPVVLQPRAREAAPRRLWFLHDTGASTSYVDPDSLERVSGRRIDVDRRVRITDASAGPVRFNTLPARVRELDHLSIALGRQIDGILSVDTFGEFLQILDYPSEQLRLREGALPAPDGRTVFSSRGPDSRPWVEVDFEGRAQRLLVDSGAGGIAFAVNRIDDFALLAPARLLTGAVRFNRLEARRVARLDGRARLAGLSFDAPILEEVPEAPLLGGEALRRFVVILDQRNRRLALHAAEAGPIPPEPGVAFGAVFRPRQDGLEVIQVFPQTPFAEAGFEAGDLITHFGDKAVAERGCEPPLDAQQLDLRVIRGGAERTVSIRLWPVLPAPER